MADIPEFAIAKLKLEPGDVLVLKFPKPLSREQMQNIRETFRINFPNVKAMILDSGADLSVLTVEDIEKRMVDAA